MSRHPCDRAAPRPVRRDLGPGAKGSLFFLFFFSIPPLPRIRENPRGASNNRHNPFPQRILRLLYVYESHGTSFFFFGPRLPGVYIRIFSSRQAAPPGS